MAVYIRTYVYEWGRNESLCCHQNLYLVLHELYTVDGVHLVLSGVPGGRWSMLYPCDDPGLYILFLRDWKCCPLNFADDPSIMTFGRSWSIIQTCSGVSVRLSSSLLIVYFHGFLR